MTRVAPPDRPDGDRLRVLVAGAGVAGLACAHHLLALATRRGLAIDLILLEASARTGGVVVTDRIEGRLIEGGPDSFVTDKPWALDLCRRLGLEDEIVGTNPASRRSFVYTRGRLVAIPEGYQLLAPSRILPFVTTPILSLRGKLRAAGDLVLPRGAERPDESLASFVRRRFGSETLERLAQPLLAGIYNADPERLSLRATMPRFLDLERAHRSVILGLMKSRAAAPAAADEGVSGARYSLFVTLRSGMQTLSDRLAAALPRGTIRLGSRVLRLSRRSGDAAAAPAWIAGTDGNEELEADAVVLALPARAAAPIVRALDSDLSALLGSIRYGDAATVGLVYRRSDVPHPLDGFGFVVPRSARRRLVACSFSSVKFPGRVPSGEVVLRAFVDGRSASGLASADLERIARDELRDILGIQAPPIVARSYRFPGSMAQYEVGHLALVQSVQERLSAHPGLHLAGNALNGVGIPDCVRSGERAAEEILEQACRREMRPGAGRGDILGRTSNPR